MTLKPPPLLKPTVQRFYGMERERQVGLPTPDQVRYETSLQAFLSSLSPAAGMASLAAPPASTSAVYRMLGLGLAQASGGNRVVVTVSGTVANSVNNGETDLQLYYGAGAPPVNGAAVTGTAIGSPLRYQASTGGSLAPFSKTVLIAGLTPGVSYWFDLAMKVVSGSGSVSNVDLAANALI